MYSKTVKCVVWVTMSIAFMLFPFELLAEDEVTSSDQVAVVNGVNISSTQFERELDFYMSQASQRGQQIPEFMLPKLKNDIVKDSKKWGGFNLNPTNVINHTKSPFIEVIGFTLLEKNLEYDIKNQQKDGSWPLNWSWREVDPEKWKIAEREWKGHITLIKLKLFKEFNLIEY